MRYEKYRLNWKEILESVVSYIFMDAVVAYLFYESIWTFVIGLSGYAVYLKLVKERFLKKRKDELREQFCEMIDNVATGLSAGLSIENSIVESRYEMTKLYGEDSLIVDELNEMLQKIKINKPIEKCFLDFANRSGIQEIRDFSTIFVYAKQSGWSVKEVIIRTVKMIKEKSTTEREIETLLKGKQLEQKIMNLIPFYIMGYLKLSSPEFSKILYHNPLGIVVMTICLVVYVAAVFLSRKIVDIKV